MRFIILILFCFLLTGCNNVEIEEYAIILGLGVDKIENEYELSVEVMDADLNKNYSVKGESFEECFERLNKRNQNIPYLNHCKLILFGDEFAREGIVDFLTYVLHKPEFRLITNLCVASNQTAKEILEYSGENYPLISIDINSSFLLNFNSVCVIDYANASTILNKIYRNVDFLLPICQIYENNIDITGGALIASGKLVTYLTGCEVTPIKLLNKNLNNGLWIIDDYNIEIEKSTVNYHLKEDEIEIDIKLDVNLYTDYDMTIVKNIILAKINEAIINMKENRRTYFDIKDMAYRKNPKVYLKMGENYPFDCIYKINLTVNKLSEGLGK